MPLKSASVSLDGEGLRFLGRTGSGHAVVLDDTTGDRGMRPAELVPLALAGCTAMDVISILRKKRQAVRRYEVEAHGLQEDDHPNAFVRIDIVHVVDGRGIDVEAVRRAIELSATKYCSVGATLASGRTEVNHRYLVRDVVTAEERFGDVLTMGPGDGSTMSPSLAAAG